MFHFIRFVVIKLQFKRYSQDKENIGEKKILHMLFIRGICIGD